MEDAILYSSCFDANGGLFETCWARKMPLSPMP
jgi:7-keto-8-aminopelargonate synthetase-like enzyme